MQDNTSNQEMTVEDILSSIKDILEDTPNSNNSTNTVADQDIAPNPKTNTQQPPASQPLSQKVEVAPQEQKQDIIKLSKDQIITTQTPKQDHTNFESIDKQIQNTTTNIDDFDLPDFPTTSSEKNNNINTKKEDVKPIVEEKPQAIDTSTEIVNNFAKMFSTPAKPKEDKKTATPIKHTKTENIPNLIENLALEAIKEKINNTNLDAIINYQVKAWIEDNLPKVVENLVQNKIEEALNKKG